MNGEARRAASTPGSTPGSRSVTPRVPFNLRLDRLLDGRVSLYQPAEGYRVAVDAVLLAAAAAVRPGDSVLDLGCGVGAAALCVLARVPETRAVGLDIQPDLAVLAGANAALNGLCSRFVPLAGDVGRPPFGRDAVFDHAICNPPYQRAGTGRVAASAMAQTANVEGAARLPDWIATALRLVRPKGAVTFIHRADRVDEVLAALSGRAGDIVVRPVHPRSGVDARRVLVSARPGVSTSTRVASALVLHDSDGADTDAARAVLRNAAALDM